MKIRWKRWFTVLLLTVAALAVALVVAYETGVIEERLGRTVVHRIEQATGGRVQLGAFHLRLWPIRAELDDLTVHGTEPSSAAPLVRAARVSVAIHIVSLFKKQLSLDELVIEQPQVRMQFEKDGRSNLPIAAPHTGTRPWRDTLFDLRIGHLDLREGAATINDLRVPLSLAAHDIVFQLHSDGDQNAPNAYSGRLECKHVRLAERHDMPFPFDASAKFTLRRDSFDLDDFTWKLPHSELNVRGELPSFAVPSNWNLHYRGRLSLADVRAMRQANGQEVATILDTTFAFHTSGFTPAEWKHGATMKSLTGA